MRITAAIICAGIYLLLSSTPAAAIQCQSHGGNGTSWRLIDGRKCHYQGRRKIDKHNLHWRAPTAVPARPVVERRRPKSLTAPRVAAEPEPEKVMPEIISARPAPIPVRMVSVRPATHHMDESPPEPAPVRQVDASAAAYQPAPPAPAQPSKVERPMSWSWLLPFGFFLALGAILAQAIRTRQST